MSKELIIYIEGIPFLNTEVTNKLWEQAKREVLLDGGVDEFSDGIDFTTHSDRDRTLNVTS